MTVIVQFLVTNMSVIYISVSTGSVIISAIILILNVLTTIIVTGNFMSIASKNINEEDKYIVLSICAIDLIYNLLIAVGVYREELNIVNFVMY